jgi:hypothetical protein
MLVVLYRVIVLQNKVKASVASAIVCVGACVCACLIGIRFTTDAVWLGVLVPWCSVGMIIDVGVLVYIVVGMIVRHKLRKHGHDGQQWDEHMEKILFFASGLVFGPLALLIGALWQWSKERRYYIHWLWMCMGSGLWTVMVGGSLATLLALQDNPSPHFSFTNDVGVCWLLFVFGSSGAVCVVVCAYRLTRNVPPAVVRPNAHFVVQVWLQFCRCYSETVRYP